MKAYHHPPVQHLSLLRQHWLRLRQVSIFEKVIIANSAIILSETLAGWWITQHNPETYHYLIDTSFIALAAVLGMLVNFLLLRAAFAPLRSLLATISAVETGDLDARAQANASDPDVLALARTFNAMLDRLELARRDASGRVLRAQEEERRHLALELHDQTGQSLTALTLHAQAIVQVLTGEPGKVAAQARQQAEHLAHLAQRTLAEVQTLARQLRPPMLDDLGLVAALRWLAEESHERLGTQAQVHIRGTNSSEDAEKSLPERLPGEVETALFRIAQESVTNAVRHGHARQVHLVLRRKRTGVSLMIIDNGIGFAPVVAFSKADHQARRRGLGLEGMRERAQLLGGTLSLRSQPEHGCVVRAVIPERCG